MYGFPGDTIYLNNLDVYALCLFRNKVILILNLYNEAQCNAIRHTKKQLMQCKFMPHAILHMTSNPCHPYSCMGV